jgi:phosphate transport system ATP-binding protein
MTSLSVHNLSVAYNGAPSLKQVSVDFPAQQITAIIGPSGCGKSTLLKSLNRLLDLQEEAQVTGQVILDGEAIYAPGVDVTDIRTRVGLLAQKPYPLPMSIYDNVAYGLRIHGLYPKNRPAMVEHHLRAVRLSAPATSLSVGQQQRLCLARSLAVEPEVLLCDESTASLDPLSARGVEELLRGFKGRYTIIMVTHDIDQARRLADHVLFLWLGELVEQGPAELFFAAPQHPITQDYLERRIG